VVFGYATYLIARGLFNRRPAELAIGVVVTLLWGGALLAGLEPQRGISWQGHLFGAIGGVVAARVLSERREAGRSI
jgi:membrane associated rhomboid family serine protease